MVVHKVYLAVLFLGLVVSSSAFGAKIQPVYSLKNLGDHNDAAGNAFQKVQIKCNTDSDFRYIHKNSGAESWCVNGDSKECFAERIDAATRACSVSAQSIASVPRLVAPTSPSPQELQAQAERKALEEELLANQQKKIELRSRQLELRKRELELRGQPESN